MLPNTKVTITASGDQFIEALEKSDQCHKLSDLAKAAGKVTKDESKDHPPVHQTVSQKAR
jgi:hypothetical protein